MQVPLSAAHPVAPPAAVTLVASTPLWGCNHAGKWLARTFKLIQKRPTSRRKTGSSKACNFDDDAGAEACSRQLGVCGAEAVHPVVNESERE